MITLDARLTGRWLYLEQIVVEQYEHRDLARVQFYADLLARSDAATTGPISVRPCGDHFAILDGHHRYMAHIIAGRRQIAVLVITEPIPDAAIQTRALATVRRNNTSGGHSHV